MDHRERLLATKKDVLQELGPRYFIDDQLKHCCAAVELEGVNAILFGDYTWNQTDILPAGVTRCRTWLDIEQYFQDRGVL